MERLSAKSNQEFFLMGKEEAVSAIERWLAQAFELRSGSILPRREVYDAYIAWCGDHNVEATAQSAFGKILHRVFPSLQSRRMGGKGRHVMCYQDFASSASSSSSTMSASPSASLSSHLAVASTITPTSNSPDPSPRSRPNRSSSPPSIGRDQRTSLAEALTHSAPTRLSRRPHKQQPPSAIHTHPKAAQDTNQPSSPPQERQRSSGTISGGSRKRVRSVTGTVTGDGEDQPIRRSHQRGGASVIQPESSGDDDDSGDEQREMEKDDDDGLMKAGNERDGVDGVHLERLHLKGARVSVKGEEAVHLQTWLERELEDDIQLLRQNEPRHLQQHHNHNSTLQQGHTGMGLLQDAFGFAAPSAGGIGVGGQQHLGPSELFDTHMAARRFNAPLPFQSSPHERMPAEGSWLRSMYTFPTMSFSSPSQHPWIVCPFFTTLAFMRQGINGDQAILPLAEHFIRLTEHFLEGDLNEAENQLARARAQISRVFDATRVEVAWSLLCLTWWNRLLLRDDDGLSKCVYYLALSRQMCVQLRLPSSHDVATSAHLSPLQPAVAHDKPTSAIDSTSSTLSPPSASPSLGMGFSRSSYTQCVSPNPLIPASSPLPSLPQFGGYTSSRPLTPSSPPSRSLSRFSSSGCSGASSTQSDMVSRLNRELYACKTMKEHIDASLPYCKIENDLLQCLIVTFDLLLSHVRGSTTVSSGALALINHLLYLPPSILTIYIFELSLKEHLLETLLAMLPQYVNAGQIEALYHSMGAMHSLLPVARAMELMRFSVRSSQ